MARLTSDLVLSLNDRVSGAARGIGSALDRLDRKQRDIASNVRGNNRLTAESVSEMGRAQVMTLGQAATAAAEIVIPLTVAEGVRMTVEAAANFESALTGIQKKAGTTAAQTAMLGEEIKNLAKSGELAVPIEEILGAYERGAAAGLPLDELREFAVLSAKAADSFDMAASDVGNAAAGFKVGLGIPIGEMEKYFDLINGLADTGIADESDLINFLDRSGASLKQFGLSAKESAAYAATMLNLKMAPDVGANAMSTLTGKLLSPGSKKAQQALAGIVGNTSDFTKLLKRDANGAVLKFLDSINQLDKFKATKLLGDFVGDGFDDEVLRLAKGVGEARKNLAYAGGTEWFGSLGKSYQLKLDDMWSQWQLLQNDMSVLAIDVGTMGMPAVKSSFEVVRGIVDEVSHGLDNLKASVNIDELTAAKTAVGELASAVGDVLLMGGEGSAIENFFNRLALSANLVSGSVNLIKDALEAVGVVAPDKDTGQDIFNRMKQWGSDFADWNPVVGAARDAAVNVNRHAAESDKSLQRDQFRDKTSGAPKDDRMDALDSYLNGPLGGPPTIVLPPARPSGEGATALPYGTSPARAPQSNDLGLKTGQPATPTPRPSPQVRAMAAAGITPSAAAVVTVPPVTLDTGAMDAAVTKATSTGAAITAALTVKGRPEVDITGISNALSVVRQLSAELRAIPGLANSAARASYNSSASEGVLNADIER